MPWPEKDLLTRTLAGIVGAILGAFLGFMLGYTLATFHVLASSTIASCVFAGAVVGFLAGVWKGDPAIRFLIRGIGNWL
jgi:hypothetical protein